MKFRELGADVWKSAVTHELVYLSKSSLGVAMNLFLSEAKSR